MVLLMYWAHNINIVLISRAQIFRFRARIRILIMLLCCRNIDAKHNAISIDF